MLEFDKIKLEIKEHSSAKINELSIDGVHTLDRELKIMNYLNISMKHFSDMLINLHQNFTGEITTLPSVRKIFKIIEMIGEQNLLRNNKAKAAEAFVMLYNLSKLRKDMVGTVAVVTFLIDHHELYDKQIFQLTQCFSTPTIEETISVANEEVENCLNNFDKYDVDVQSYMFSYLFSLSSYYGKINDLVMAANTLTRCSTLFDKWEVSDESQEKSGYKIILEAKKYSCYVDIINYNPGVFTRNSHNFIFFAAQELYQFKNVNTFLWTLKHEKKWERYLNICMLKGLLNLKIYEFI